MDMWQFILVVYSCYKIKFSIDKIGEKNLPRTGFEPVTYGYLLLIQLQSTALPTELSRGYDNLFKMSHIFKTLCSLGVADMKCFINISQDGRVV